MSLSKLPSFTAPWIAAYCVEWKSNGGVAGYQTIIKNDAILFAIRVGDELVADDLAIACDFIRSHDYPAIREHVETEIAIRLVQP